MLVPFKGWRLSAEVLNGQEPLCLPFDCITPEMEKRLRAVPYNAVHLEEPRPNQKTGSKIWARWKQSGWVVPDAPSYYLLVDHFEGKERLGILGLLELSRHKKIWPHEHCYRRYINLRKRHAMKMSLHLSPVFLVAPDEKQDLDQVLKEIYLAARQSPHGHSMTFKKSVFDGVERRVYALGNPAWQKRLKAALLKQPGLLIADGHHRTTAALELAQEGKMRHALAYVTSAQGGAGLLRPHPPIPGRKHVTESIPDLSAIFELASRGERMPRKSTYFWPKIPVGMVYGEI